MKQKNTIFEEFDGGYSSANFCNVGAIVGAGIAAAGSIAGASASESAADKQANAANNASQAGLAATNQSNQLQWSALQESLQNQAPTLQGNQASYAALLGGLGLGGTYGTPGSTQPGGVSNPSQAANGPGGVATNGTPSGSGSFTSSSGATVDANGNPVLANQFTPQNYGLNQSQLQTAAGTLAPGSLTSSFTPSDLTKDPGYQFRINQGEQALKAAGAATGTLQTGQGLKDINDYAQDAGSQEYQNEFNRFQTQQGNEYNRLLGASGVGSPAANASSSANTATAGDIANTTMSGVNSSNQNLIGGANASAAGTVGQANALIGGLGSGANTWMGYQYLNRVPTPGFVGQAGNQYTQYGVGAADPNAASNGQNNYTGP